MKTAIKYPHLYKLKPRLDRQSRYGMHRARPDQTKTRKIAPSASSLPVSIKARALAFRV